MAARLRTKQLLLARTSLDRLHRLRARCAVHAGFTQLHAVAVQARDLYAIRGEAHADGHVGLRRASRPKHAAAPLRP